MSYRLNSLCAQLIIEFAGMTANETAADRKKCKTSVIRMQKNGKAQKRTSILEKFIFIRNIPVIKGMER